MATSTAGRPEFARQTPAKAELSPLTVVKLDHAGQEVIRYPGRLLEKLERKVVLEAAFGGERVPLGQIVLRRGDRFVETYYTDRWYNIFEIYDREDGGFKCWYCNVSYPAQVDGEVVSYRDLALDLLVYPDGRQVVLDEDEFASLSLPDEVQAQARQALEELQRLFRRKAAED